jgi:Peptidase A4 family
VPDRFLLSAHAVRRRSAAVALLIAGVLLALPTAAQAAAQVSTNWAGYVAAPHRPDRESFSSVSGTWVVPAATCSAGDQAYSTVWVGLGGSSENAKGLEQAGTEQDCSRTGAASYGAWFEILPAAPVAVRINMHPGDTVTVSTTVAGHGVTFQIRDLTTGAHYATTRRASVTDVSSAEWILEAPSSCSSSGVCEALPLAKVGTVDFDSATARAGDEAGTAGDAVWSNTALDLEQESISVPRPPYFNSEAQTASGPTRTIVTAAPSATGASNGSFSVSLSEQTTELSLPSVPTLPGFGR